MVQHGVPLPRPAKVLLVDDHEENLLALEVILEARGLEFVRASSGAEALRCVLRDSFAVILLDVAGSSGCPSAGTCTARLVQGAESPSKKGDLLRVYGHVSRAFSVQGRADLPEIEVDFLLKGAK